MISTSLNHCKKMGAGPGRRFLKRPAAKLEPVIVVHQICSRDNQGHADRSGDSRGNCLIVCPPPNSSIEECVKYRHLKQVKTSFDK